MSFSSTESISTSANYECVRLGSEKKYSGQILNSSGQPVWVYSDDAKKRWRVDLNTRGEETFGLHASEFGWSLPRKHRRHILNFPGEILTHILIYALVTPVGVTPLTIPSAKAGHEDRFTEPSYRINDWERAELPCCIEELPNGKRRAFFRAPIDATCLRVSKYLLQLGRQLLYGENVFEFDLESDAYIREPPIPTNRYIKSFDGSFVHCGKDLPTSKDLQSSQVQNSIRDMFQKSQPEMLDDWLRCDPFARFLHAIGPVNASCIRHVRIIGILSPWHECYLDFTNNDDVYFNLSYYTKVYAMFLHYHCQNLETLEVHSTSIAISYSPEMDSFPSFVDVFEHRIRLPYDDWNGYGEELDYDSDIDDYLGEFDEIRDGDASLETFVEGGLQVIRASREKKRQEKKADILRQRQDNVILRLQPLLEDIISKLPNLRSLGFLRPPIPTWMSYFHKYNKVARHDSLIEIDDDRDDTNHPRISEIQSQKDRKLLRPVELKFMEDIRYSLTVAALRRSLELDTEAQAKRSKVENPSMSYFSSSSSDLNPRAPCFLPGDWRDSNIVGKRIAASKRETFGGWGWSGESRGSLNFNRSLG